MSYHVVEQLRAWQSLTSDLPAADGAMPAKPAPTTSA